uniref:Integral membrane protein n=1 Tax=Heterorhabditis bacteriophora TaxID=37862 RepID=A0A1I7X9X5_HETBA
MLKTSGTTVDIYPLIENIYHVQLVFTTVVGDLAVSNTILFTANIGLGFYVYFRRHLHRLNSWDRVEFRTSSWARTILAASLSIYLLSRARKYLHHVDARVSRISPSPRSLRSPIMAVEKNGHVNSPQRATNGTDFI